MEKVEPKFFKALLSCLPKLSVIDFSGMKIIQELQNIPEELTDIILSYKGGPIQ